MITLKITHQKSILTLALLLSASLVHGSERKEGCLARLKALTQSHIRNASAANLDQLYQQAFEEQYPNQAPAKTSSFFSSVRATNNFFSHQATPQTLSAAPEKLDLSGLPQDMQKILTEQHAAQYTLEELINNEPYAITEMAKTLYKKPLTTAGTATLTGATAATLSYAKDLIAPARSRSNSWGWVIPLAGVGALGLGLYLAFGDEMHVIVGFKSNINLALVQLKNLEVTVQKLDTKQEKVEAQLSDMQPEIEKILEVIKTLEEFKQKDSVITENQKHIIADLQNVKQFFAAYNEMKIQMGQTPIAPKTSPQDNEDDIVASAAEERDTDENTQARREFSKKQPNEELISKKASALKAFGQLFFGNKKKITIKEAAV